MQKNINRMDSKEGISFCSIPEIPNILRQRKRRRFSVSYTHLPDSPLFGKDKMATFERYFIEAKETHLEKKNPYYELLEKEAVVDEILEERCV